MEIAKPDCGTRMELPGYVDPDTLRVYCSQPCQWINNQALHLGSTYSRRRRVEEEKLINEANRISRVISDLESVWSNKIINPQGFDLVPQAVAETISLLKRKRNQTLMKIGELRVKNVS